MSDKDNEKQNTSGDIESLEAELGGQTNGNNNEVDDIPDDQIQEMDNEIEAMKRKVQEMEEETQKINQLQKAVDSEFATTTEEAKKEIDARSVWVGNVDFGSRPEELQEHFKSCGTINRVTILCDKFTGQAKGYAYVEFADSASVEQAKMLDGSEFRARNLKVMPKRNNKPGYAKRRFRPRRRRPTRGFRPYHARARFHPYM
eukprot:gb/GECH01012810.1/.p1 GENE.gb/GECH01012810.1/~~gb/GECH01012810.1/.p1  ORF type:complete len:202 (+),score=73.45 gb/GECH01012810.1/:1-606(+)